MVSEELLQKAKELGLTDEEIAQFIQNQKDAEKYGFTDDCTSVNVKIDKDLDPDGEEEVHSHCCEDGCCHNHEDEEECDCCSHNHCNCHHN